MKADVELKEDKIWYVQLRLSRGQRITVERAIELCVATSQEKDAQPDGWPVTIAPPGASRREEGQEDLRAEGKSGALLRISWLALLARLDKLCVCVWCRVCVGVSVRNKGRSKYSPVHRLPATTTNSTFSFRRGLVASRCKQIVVRWPLRASCSRGGRETNLDKAAPYGFVLHSAFILTLSWCGLQVFSLAHGSSREP